MTLIRLRQILKHKAKGWSDERLQAYLDGLTIIADLAADNAIKQFSLQDTTNSVYIGTKAPIHVRKSPSVAISSQEHDCALTAGDL